MRYLIYFASSGTPTEGLSPTIDIFLKLSDGDVAGTPPIVYELGGSGIDGGGFYYFDYTPTEKVAIRIDSEDSGMSDGDRYISMLADPDDDAAEAFKDVELGNWVITKSTNKFTLYKRDGITVLQEFDLTDDANESKREV